ncbi:hypothetical protein HELRODRAFT_163003 [Helobdella robusta]|uniref:Uncharacterized protein n=1 Tax=Helobdella robusta TaxID=6412 RepID=T1ETJ5_HELRO|nr:hypothetical protein HELRODRAFT_163003 [Helobdella robusta]ESN99454.1 hypothetical protein HELRODRAFT_163003 [Helobdella robusta]
MLTNKALETTFYVTDHKQQTDFFWFRDSGMRINIGLQDIQIIPTYEEATHRGGHDNDFILGSQMFTYRKNAFMNILKEQCSNPLPSHYKLTLEIFMDRTTKLVNKTCSLEDFKYGQCPDAVLPNELFEVRSLNEPCIAVSFDARTSLFLMNIDDHRIRKPTPLCCHHPGPPAYAVLFFQLELQCAPPQRRKLPLEPSGISVQDGKRPDGCTLTPWRSGKCLAWDVTVPGTLAERYVHLTSKECGLAAIRALDEKIKKYEHALPSLDFLPICIEGTKPDSFPRISNSISCTLGLEFIKKMFNVSLSQEKEIYKLTRTCETASESCESCINAINKCSSGIFEKYFFKIEHESGLKNLENEIIFSYRKSKEKELSVQFSRPFAYNTKNWNENRENEAKVEINYLNKPRQYMVKSPTFRPYIKISIPGEVTFCPDYYKLTLVRTNDNEELVNLDVLITCPVIFNFAIFVGGIKKSETSLTLQLTKANRKYFVKWYLKVYEKSFKTNKQATQHSFSNGSNIGKMTFKLSSINMSVGGTVVILCFYAMFVAPKLYLKNYSTKLITFDRLLKSKTCCNKLKLLSKLLVLILQIFHGVLFTFSCLFAMINMTTSTCTKQKSNCLSKIDDPVDANLNSSLALLHENHNYVTYTNDRRSVIFAQLDLRNLFSGYQHASVKLPCKIFQVPTSYGAVALKCCHDQAKSTILKVTTLKAKNC